MKLIIGAGDRKQDGWISTEQNQLDLLKPEDFSRILNGAIGFESMVMEHVLEHLSEDDVLVALKNCYDNLSPNGRLRIAVPDGLHPDKDYIEYVRPGGTGAGADSHKMLFNYRMLGRMLRQVGFSVSYIEWWDESGNFNTRPWNEIDGYIERCLANDPRNNDGKPHYTSLIVDAVKGSDNTRPNLEKAFAFVEENDPHKVSPFNRKKTMTFYELARLAPKGGVIVELGSFHGVGTAALFYGSMDGNDCPVYAVDAYKSMRGWANEPYEPEDAKIWQSNMKNARINPTLVMKEASTASDEWNLPISLLVHDLGSKNRMPIDVLDWEEYVMVGGTIAMRDIDDYSMGTEQAVKNLLATGRWGKRRNWEAFITSMERIK